MSGATGKPEQSEEQLSMEHECPASIAEPGSTETNVQQDTMSSADEIVGEPLQRSLSDSDATFQDMFPGIASVGGFDALILEPEKVTIGLDVTSVKLPIRESGDEGVGSKPDSKNPPILSDEEEKRFEEIRKFCPTTLANKDCPNEYRCALIQPCRKYSPVYGLNFCHLGSRCHNSHTVKSTCRSVFRGVACTDDKCEKSHDKNVRLAVEKLRQSHEKGEYGVD